MHLRFEISSPKYKELVVHSEVDQVVIDKHATYIQMNKQFYDVQHNSRFHQFVTSFVTIFTSLRIDRQLKFGCKDDNIELRNGSLTEVEFSIYHFPFRWMQFKYLLKITLYIQYHVKKSQYCDQLICVQSQLFSKKEFSLEPQIIGNNC